jgi:hypothetical protein
MYTGIVLQIASKKDSPIIGDAMKPGVTLSDAKGAKRIRKLEDSVLNLQMQVLEKLDCIAVMESEIKVMRESQME